MNLEPHYLDRQGCVTFDRGQLDLRLEGGQGKADLKESEVEPEINPAPDPSMEVVVLQGHFDPAVQDEGTQGNIELHFSVNLKLAVGAEVAVDLDLDEVEEVDRQLVDGNLEDPACVRKAQVTLALEEQDANLGGDPDEEAVGGDPQAQDGTGIDLEGEAPLDIHQRDGHAGNIQPQIDDQCAVLVYPGAALDSGPAERPEFHVGVEGDREAFAAHGQVESALDDEHVVDVEFTAPFHDQGGRCDSGLFELVCAVGILGNVPRLRIDFQAVDGRLGGPGIDGQAEVSAEGEQISAEVAPCVKGQASHKPFAVDVEEPTGRHGAQRREARIGGYEEGNPAGADIEVEVAVEFQDAAQEAERPIALDDDIGTGGACSTRETRRTGGDRQAAVSDLGNILLRDVKRDLLPRRVHEELKGAVEFQGVAHGNASG